MFPNKVFGVSLYLRCGLSLNFVKDERLHVCAVKDKVTGFCSDYCTSGQAVS